MSETIFYMDTDQGNDIPIPASDLMGSGYPFETFDVIFTTENTLSEIITGAASDKRRQDL